MTPTQQTALGVLLLCIYLFYRALHGDFGGWSEAYEDDRP